MPLTARRLRVRRSTSTTAPVVIGALPRPMPTGSSPRTRCTPASTLRSPGCRVISASSTRTCHVRSISAIRPREPPSPSTTAPIRRGSILRSTRGVLLPEPSRTPPALLSPGCTFDSSMMRAPNCSAHLPTTRESSNSPGCRPAPTSRLRPMLRMIRRFGSHSSIRASTARSSANQRPGPASP